MSSNQRPKRTTNTNSSTDWARPDTIAPEIWDTLLGLHENIALADRFFSHLNSNGSRGIRVFRGTQEDIYDLASLRITPGKCVLDLHAWVRNFRFRVQKQYPSTKLPDVPPAPAIKPGGETLRLSDADFLHCSDSMNVLSAWVKGAAAALRKWKGVDQKRTDREPNRRSRTKLATACELKRMCPELTRAEVANRVDCNVSLLSDERYAAVELEVDAKEARDRAKRGTM